MFLHSFRSSTLLAVLFVGAATLPSSLLAQQSAVADPGKSAAQAATVAVPAPVITANPAPVAGPRVSSAWSINSLPSPLDLSQPQSGRVGAGPNIALMGTGAAAVVVGLLVGGDGGTILSLSGGVIGLVGLYRFLR